MRSVYHSYLPIMIAKSNIGTTVKRIAGKLEAHLGEFTQFPIDFERTFFPGFDPVASDICILKRSEFESSEKVDYVQIRNLCFLFYFHHLRFRRFLVQIEVSRSPFCHGD